MKPKVPPETDEAVHEHVCGSFGGPGENSADCACGLSFAGFDTCAEVMAALNEHIAAATAGKRGSKFASYLGFGDWLATSSTGDKEPLKVLGILDYEDGDDEAVAVVYQRRSGGEPAVMSFSPADMVLLATAEEINPPSPWAAMIAELRRIVDALEPLDSRPDPYVSLAILPARHNADDDESRAAVDAVCQAVFGGPARDEPNGNVMYRVRRGDRHGVHLSVHASLFASAKPVDDPTGNGYSREVDNGDASTPVPEGVDGSAMTGRGADGGCE